MCTKALGLTAAALLLATWMWQRLFGRRDSVGGRHVLITGGSEGIGLALAKLCVERGAKVSLLARSPEKLTVAIEELKRVASGAQVIAVTADVGDRPALAAALSQSQARLGPPDFCIAAAGAATPKYFEDLGDQDFHRMMHVNYMGVVHLAQEVLPGMAQRGTGHFCAVCSMVAAVPFVGYAAYAPAKAACRAFIDVLRNEFSDTGVKFHLAFPPDTDTPGFATENETKPYETAHIWPECFNEVFPARKVAEWLLEDMLNGHYFLRSPDLFGNMLVSRSWGHFPRALLPLELCIAPIFVCLHEVMVWMADRAVRSRAHHAARQPASAGSSS